MNTVSQTAAAVKPALRLLFAPVPHRRFVDATQTILDYLEECLLQQRPGSRRHRELVSHRNHMLRELVQAEQEHEEASEPVAWRPADCGRGVDVITRGGWEVNLPERTPADMEAAGIERIGF